jgi:hypothetical protein
MGYSPLEGWRSFPSGEGERHRVGLEPTAGRCYLFVALGRGGIGAVALRLSRGERLLAADLARRSHAWVAWCAEDREPMGVELEVLSGAGNADLGMFAAWRMEVIEWTGPPVLPEDPQPELPARISSAERELARAGYDPGEALLEGVIEAGTSASARARLEAGRCAVISVHAGPGVGGLALEVRSDRGRVFTDSSSGTAPRIPVCASEDEELAIEVEGTGGGGPFRLAINRLPVIDVDAGGAGEVPLAMKEAAASFSRRGMRPVPGGIALERGADRGAWRSELRLEAGSCYGVAVTAVEPVLSAADIRGPGGSPRHWWTGPGNLATLALCPDAPGSHLLTVKTLDSPHGGVAPLAVLFSADERAGAGD